MAVGTRDIQLLLDEAAIRRLLARYSRAVDRGDLDALRDVYHADATDDHGPLYSGDIDGFIEVIRASLALGTVTCTRHCVSSVSIAVDGDVAVAESYFDAYHRRRVDDRWVDELAAGRYLDRLERRDGEWRIAARRVVWDRVHSAAGMSFPWEPEHGGYQAGSRSGADASVAWFRDWGPGGIVARGISDSSDASDLQENTA